MLRILKFNREVISSNGSEARDIFNKLIPLEDCKVDQQRNYHSVVDFFILPDQYQHITLEGTQYNSYIKPTGYTPSPCKNHYQYFINNSLHPKFLIIIINGTKSVLSKLFIDQNALLEPDLTNDLVNSF